MKKITITIIALACFGTMAITAMSQEKEMKVNKLVVDTLQVKQLVVEAGLTPKKKEAEVPPAWQIIPPFTAAYKEQHDSVEKVNRRNRYVILSNKGNSNFVAEVYRRPYCAKNNWYDKKRRTNHFNKNSQIKIFVEHPDFIGLETISVSIEGSNYSYTEDLSGIHNTATTAFNETNLADAKNIDQALTIYLKTTYDILKSRKFMSLGELKRLHAYQIALNDSLQKIKLTQDQLNLATSIINYTPRFVSITDFPLSAIDADEIVFVIKTKRIGSDVVNEHKTCSRSVSGGAMVTTGASVYLTNLSNQPAYADSLATSTGMEYRAFLQESSKINIGIGTNVDVIFRSGGPIAGIFCMGFFIPFEEKITPYIAPGGGIAFVSSKVKITLTGGPAFAKVNVLNPRYADRDLSGLNLANETLTIQQWRIGYFISLGVSFNLSKSE